MLVLLFINSCSNHGKISVQDVSSIDIGGFPQGTYVHSALTTIDDLTHDSLFKSVHVYDSSALQSIVCFVNELSRASISSELDLRKVIFIHLKNGETMVVGLGESSGTMFNDRPIQDNEKLFEIADSILYLAQDRDFWLPDFLR